MAETTPRKLQDWYELVNRIYVDRNFYRSIESIHCHLVEVARGLATAASPRRKRDLNPAEFLPKTLAWWLALCGRAGVQNVEEMLWVKFPGVCPYCQYPTHRGGRCKESNPSKAIIDWDWLKAEGEKRALPLSLTAWQQMFNDIYPRDDGTDHETNVNRLAEELGELAEAVRTLSVAPEYFVSEAPDVFAWLMGFANQFDFDARREPHGVALEQWMQSEYPGACKYCRRSICKCPPVPSTTLGRIAKDAPRRILERGKLISLQESIALFRSAEDVLRIGVTELPATPMDAEKVLKDIHGLLLQLANAQMRGQWVPLAASLGVIREQLSSASEVTQDALDSVINATGQLDDSARIEVSEALSSGESDMFRTLAVYVSGMTGVRKNGNSVIEDR